MAVPPRSNAGLADLFLSQATVEGRDYEAALSQLQGSLEDGERLLSVRLP